jgi:putative endonuclease
METKPWYVYMLECSDGTIYTGITNDIAARITKHNSGKGAKYTRVRRPVKLKAYWEYGLKSEAAKAEYAFKQLSRTEKMKLIKNHRLKKENHSNERLSEGAL